MFLFIACHHRYLSPQPNVVSARPVLEGAACISDGATYKSLCIGVYRGIGIGKVGFSFLFELLQRQQEQSESAPMMFVDLLLSDVHAL